MFHDQVHVLTNDNSVRCIIINVVSLQEQEKQQYMTGKVGHFEELDKWMSNQQYVTGNKLNIMDFVLFEDLDAHNAAMPEFLGQFPNLQHYHQRMMVSVTILFTVRQHEILLTCWVSLRA